MSKERPKLSRKWRISRKSYLTLANSKSVEIKVPEYLGQWSCHSEIISSFILEISLSLALCWWRPRIINKMTDFGKSFYTLANAKSIYVMVPEYLGYCSRDLEVISSFVLIVLLRLVWCSMDAPNYQQNDGFLENCSKLYSVPKMYR